MVENRKAPRVNFDHKHQVTLMGIDGTWRRSCILLDVSQSGAQLEIEGSPEVLKAREFFMSLSTTGLAFRRCELVWVQGAAVGIRFISNDARKQVAGSQADGRQARRQGSNPDTR
jgi:hypothetical protein